MSEDTRIFGASFKRRYNTMLAVGTFLAGGAPFGVGLLIVHIVWPEESGIGPPLIAAAALVTAPVASWLVHNRLALGGNSTLRRRLREQIDVEGHSFPDGVQPVFVGFSPGDEPLVWDGDTDRDVGFLAAWGDALVYYGEDFAWYLPRDRIDIIEPVQPVSGISRILIRWHAPRERNRALTIVSREAASLRAATRSTHQLLQQLYTWVARPHETSEQPPKIGMPPTDVSGGRPLSTGLGGSCLVMLSMLAATVVAAWQVSAPFVAAERYSHAVLASGGIFVVGFTLTNVILRLLQWAEEMDQADGAASTT